MDYRKLEIDIKNKKFSPVYILHGEEPYFIDQLTQLICDHALEEHEKDFNQHIVYGRDAELLSIISELKGYPMMSERRVVVIREAQDFKDIDKLEDYIASPCETSVLVIAHKYKPINGNKRIIKNTRKVGVIFKSEKVKDYKLSEWIVSFLKKAGYQINSKGAMLLSEHIGNDLSRMTNELNKLMDILDKGTHINEVHIEENIGISKDYNVFELINAIGDGDINKANQIIYYFNNNPKAADPIAIVASIFYFFTQLMKIHFIKNKSRENIAHELKLPPFIAGKLLQSSRRFSSKKIAENIEILHEYDLRSKGVNYNHSDKGPLMKELIFKLLY